MASLIKAGGKCFEKCTNGAGEATSVGSTVHGTEVPNFENDGREKARWTSNETEEIQDQKAAVGNAEQVFDGISSDSSSKAGDKAAMPTSENHVSEITVASMVPDDDSFSAEKNMNMPTDLTTEKEGTPGVKSLQATSPVLGLSYRPKVGVYIL